MLTRGPTSGEFETARGPFGEEAVDYLPERSVECLNQFFSGYSVFGPPIWRDLTSFEFWLKERLAYPEDSGSRWDRFIQLNSRDHCDGFDSFCRLYRRYCKRKPADVQPSAPETALGSDSFDFYKLLYGISKKPGMYLGASDGVQSIAAYLAGYFAGKKHIGKVGLLRKNGHSARVISYMVFWVWVQMV